MSFQNLFLITAALFCLLSAFLIFSIQSRSQSAKPRLALSIWLLTLISSVAYAVFGWNNEDFLFPFSAAQYLSPLIASMLLVLPLFHPIKTTVRAILVLALAASSIYSFNLEITLIPSLPLVFNQALAALLWTAFALSLRLLNSGNALVAVEGFSISLGIFTLSLIGAVPFALGYEGLCLASGMVAMLIYTWNPTRLSTSNAGADLLGFILGGLMVYAAAEGAGANVLIFSMLLVCETILAWAQKLTFLPHFTQLNNNTAAAKASASGLNPKVIAGHFMRINLLLLLFGCFQAYAPNQYSIPLVCAVITGWQMYRMVHWNNLSSGIRETNRAVINEIKQQVSNLQNNLNNTDKPD